MRRWGGAGIGRLVGYFVSIEYKNEKNKFLHEVLDDVFINGIQRAESMEEAYFERRKQSFPGPH